MKPNNDVVEVMADEGGGRWTPVAREATAGLKEYMTKKDDFSDEDASTALREAHLVLSQCLAPTADDRHHIGLVCGYVQSGKTASMTAVAALARDNRYRIVILLAGTTTNLVDQNRDRLQESLREASPQWDWVMLTNPKLRNSRQELHDRVASWRSSATDEEQKKTLFITVMKNTSHLNGLAELLESADLAGIPAIVFDDEADQAGLNTRPRALEASPTYRTIQRLRDALPHHTFLQYTATPQAPLLITRIDSLSADFAELVSPGQKYTGGQTFFAKKTKHVESIPDEEVFPEDDLPEAPPPSLIRAMQMFFVGVAAGLIAREKKNRSMLVHSARLTSSHKGYSKWVNHLRTYWSDVLVATGMQSTKEELLAMFRSVYDELDVPDIPQFDAIAKKLLAAITDTTVTIVNSKDGKEVQWSNSYAHILVGGEKLGRGYTVKGLTVTYMPRPPGGWTADTIQQRARFFGYHSKYLGYCRVFLNDQVKGTYEKYLDHEEDMRKRLREHRGKPLKEWRRMFYLDRRLAPTRRNVLESPYLRPKLEQGWFAPSRPHESPGDGAANSAVLSALSGLKLAPWPGHAQHQFARVKMRDVFERVLVELSYLDEDDALKLCVVNCNFTSILEKDKDAECAVVFMSYGQKARKRELSDKAPRKLKQLFQGRSSKGEQSYPGDRAICDKEVPTIQVHNLRIEGPGGPFDNVPAVAVKIPGYKDVLFHDEE